LLADFEFQIHYKKSNKNDEVNTLSRWLNYEEVKWVHAEILSEENEILTKKLAATYRVKNTSLMNVELIQECHNSQIDEHLKLRELRILYNENTVSAILKIESQSTLLSVSYVERTRFREINNIIK